MPNAENLTEVFVSNAPFDENTMCNSFWLNLNNLQDANWSFKGTTLAFDLPDGTRCPKLSDATRLFMGIQFPSGTVPRSFWQSIAPVIANMQSMFQDSNLSELSGNLTFASLTNGASAFLRTAIREIPAGLAFPVLNRTNEMFSGCSSLEMIAYNIRFPLVTSANSTFNGCAKLKAIPRNCFPVVTDASNMFTGCAALESFELDCINWASITKGSFMFQDCTTLQTLPAGATFAALTDSTAMFAHSGSKTLPAGIGFPVLTKAVSMFTGVQLTLPTGVDFTKVENATTHVRRAAVARSQQAYSSTLLLMVARCLKRQARA